MVFFEIELGLIFTTQRVLPVIRDQLVSLILIEHHGFGIENYRLTRIDCFFYFFFIALTSLINMFHVRINMHLHFSVGFLSRVDEVFL